MDRTGLYTEHLQRMVRIPTVTGKDPERQDAAAFAALRELLEEMYPLVHRHCTREIIGHFGLLFHLKGRSEKRAPLMLIAHQDVVPEGDVSLWKYPPYAAEIHDGLIWGRGTTDSKCNMQAYLDALEELLSEGFVPESDLYLGFGYNEESQAKEPAAALMAAELQRRGIALGCLIDECGGVNCRDGEAYSASIYTCEKGYVDLEFSSSGRGGHSSRPGKRTPLGAVAEAVCRVENHAFPAYLTDTTERQLRLSAPFMEDTELAELCRDPRRNWEKLCPKLEENPIYNALIRTTGVATMASASNQPNVIPQRVSVTVNCRLLPGETVAGLVETYRALVPEDVEVSVLSGADAPVEQSTDTEAYHLIERLMEERYPGVPLIPQMLLGGTDSRFYTNVCPSRSIYRFTNLRYDDRWSNTAHMVDERIPVDTLAPNVDFFRSLIRAWCE